MYCREYVVKLNMTEISKAQAKWDKRYQDKFDKPGTPSPPIFLQQNWQHLKPGRVLDLASGDGAASLFLMDKAFDVVAADISSVGLSLLEQRCRMKGHEVETYQVDLEAEVVDLSKLALFDAIVICRYKPVEALWSHLIERLKPQGTLLITTFNHLHHQRTGFSQRFCLQPDEYLSRFEGLDLLKHELDINACGEDGYLFVKKTLHIG